MNARVLWSRILVILGGIAMLLGAVDPLEGSLLSRLPLQARDTILCVISTGEAVTRSCGLRLCSCMIRAIGCSPKLRSVPGVIVMAASCCPRSLSNLTAERFLKIV